MNRLAGERSPYLLQHAGNPVDWFPWGEDAFARARAADRPIFLSVGYSTCHWCHVMERESFEDGAVAAVLNQHFVSIKVDREERPDVEGHDSGGSSSFVIGLLAGTVLGAGLGLLFAPKSGAELRQRASEDAEDLARVATERIRRATGGPDADVPATGEGARPE